MKEQPALIDIDHLTVLYDGLPAIENLTLQIPEGARVAVVGPNGAGKSTLFKALVGELPIYSGFVSIHCQPLGSHQDCVAYVPQREEIDWHFPVTVEDVVMMGRFGRLGWLRRASQQDHEAVQRSLMQIEISELAEHSISDLSGGQQQRVFLARALAQEPHLLLLDEPFNGIDSPTQNAIYHLLDDLKTKSVTVMVSIHDLNQAMRYFDHALLLNKSLVAFGKPKQVFSSRNIRAVFKDKFMMVDGTCLTEDCHPDSHHKHGSPA
jgi:manganese/iron transport system ATP-binding protein